MLLYALRHLDHAVVHAYLEGVVGKIVDFVHGDLLHSGSVGNVPLLLSGEQAID